MSEYDNELSKIVAELNRAAPSLFDRAKSARPAIASAPTPPEWVEAAVRAVEG